MWIVWLAAMVTVGWWSVDPMLARGASVPAGVRLMPKPAAGQLAVTAPGRAMDPRATDLAGGVRAALGRLQTGQPRRARRLHLEAAQTDTLGALEARAQGEVELQMRRRAGTPRLMRAPVLYPAASSAARDRDHGAATARAFLRAARGLLRLENPDDELRLVHRETDGLRRQHLRFAQMYRDFPVWPGEVRVHLDPIGNVDGMEGAFVATPRGIALAPVVDAEAAVRRARAAVPGDATGATTSESRIIYAPGDRSPRLAWKVEVIVSLAARWLVVVDALNGAILTAFNQVASANVRGTGADVFGVTRPLDVWREGNTYFMVDTSKPMFDPASDPPSPDKIRGGIVVLDANNQRPDAEGSLALSLVTASSPTAWAVPDAVSASFALSQTYDYFRERHGRESLDGNRGTILGVVRFDREYQNAFWNGTAMVFGDADPYAGALDVVGHELSHGVTQYSANLVYQNQAGALNEAFSDIFGEAVEARSAGGPDWLKGRQLGAPIQNYADPTAVEFFRGRAHPSKLSEYVDPNDPVLGNFPGRDNGGVHINSAIINHAFYLLAEGMADALGIEDAERIFYRALTTHLLANSQFIDVRLACVSAAEELFGKGSRQAQRTAQAFDAVEIFDGTSTPPPPEFPAVAGPDSTLYATRDFASGALVLGRREQVLGDGPDGAPLGLAPVAASRPSVVGDGSVAVYVDDSLDVCLVATDGSGAPECLGVPGQVNSVAVAPNGIRLGFVLRTATGDPDNAIAVVDIASGAAERFTLEAPQIDGGGLNTILFADAMDFSADGGLLVFDAFNVIQLVDGSQVGVWSIYALDLTTGLTHVLVPPTPGLDVSFPALSQTSDRFITFDVVDQASGTSTVVAGDLNSGELAAVGTVEGDVGVPSYAGDDRAIVYSVTDGTFTGASLVRQPLAEDHISPTGDPVLWLSDAGLGVIYRRGVYAGPPPTATPTRRPVTRTPTPTPTGHPAPECVGECNGDGEVTVNELIRGVTIALGAVPLAECPAFDADDNGEVTVNELVTAVNAALNGCRG